MKNDKKQTETQRYQANFKKWNKNRTDIQYTKKNGDLIYTLHPLDQEKEEFRQCYLSASQTNKKKPFYEVRKDLQKDWWVSDRGYIVSFKGDKPKGYFGQLTSKGRLQIRLSNNTLSYESIKAMCFCENLKMTEKESLKLINEQGLKAFNLYEKVIKDGEEQKIYKSDFVELHHENGIIYAKNNTEAMELLPQNSELKHISFLKRNIHDILDGIGDYYKVSDVEKKAKIITKKVVEKGISEPVFIIPGNTYKTGIITNFLDEKEDPNIIIYTDPLLKNGDTLEQATVNFLQKQVEQTDMPQQVETMINGTLYRLIAFRRIKKDLEKIRVAVDIEEITQP